MKFWETKVGKLLKKVAPEAVDIIGDTVPGGRLIKTIFDSVAGVDPEVAQEFNAALKEYELQEMQMVLNDRANARDMQKSALVQDDRFSKRFIYYLASFIMLSIVVLLILLFFIEIPERNSEIVYMAIGIFMGIVSTVAAFFFGSSAGSKNKEDGLLKAISKG